MARLLLLVGLAILVWTGSAHAITVIDFATGCVDAAPPTFTLAQGVSIPNAACFQSSLPGHVPFFYFSDNWGIVGTTAAGSPFVTIQFGSPVDFVQVDAYAQAAFDLNGTTPYTWTMRAFDLAGNEIAVASMNFGLDLVVPRAPDLDYPLGVLSLSITAPGSIATLQFESARKTGIDRITFSPSIAAVPEPSTLALLGGGGLLAAGLRSWRRGRRV